MTGRRARILVETVHRYIRTLQPVSSQELVAAYGYRFSSATVRNELLALEEGGYLHKPHTSAGRVPTAKGFRFFADWLLEVTEQREVVPGLPVEPEPPLPLGEPLLLFQRTTLLLATLTGGLAFAFMPPLERLNCSLVALHWLRPGRALAVQANQLGMVRSQIVDLPEEMQPEDLPQVERFLHALGLEKIQEASVDTKFAGWHSRAMVGALRVVQALAQKGDQPGLCVEGWAQLFSGLASHSPSWALARGQDLLRLVENAQAFRAAVLESRMGTRGLAVHVGDGTIPPLAELSVVSTPYWTEEDLLGVIGPLWMDYARAFSASKYVAGRLQWVLAQGEGDE